MLLTIALSVGMTSAQAVNPITAYKGVKALIKGSGPATRQNPTKFRNDALAITKRNSKGQYKDAYTGKYLDKKDMQADHIYPHGKGGSNSSWNSAMTHKKVNRDKWDHVKPGMMARGYANNKEVQKAAGKTAAGGAAVGSVVSY